MELFPSPFQALFEITLGLQQIFTMRKVCLFQKGFHPYAEELALRLARQGYRVEWISKEGDNLQSFQEKPREVLFLLFSEDQPWTGERLSEEALERFRKFPAFSLNLSFVTQRPAPATPEQPLHSHIQVLLDGRAVATFGGRYQSPFLLSSHLQGSFLEASAWKNLWPQAQEDAEKVRGFERFFVQELQGVPVQLAGPRYWDRALLHLKDADAGAVRTWLVEKKSAYESLHPFGLNHHRSEKALKWMIQAGYGLEELQGMMACPSKLLTERFREDLKAAVAEVRQLQKLTF